MKIPLNNNSLFNREHKYVVLNKNSEIVAHVQIMVEGGRTTGRVLDKSSDKENKEWQERTINPTRYESFMSGEDHLESTSGLVIDGHILCNGRDVYLDGHYDANSTAPEGYYFGDYDREASAFTRLYRIGGLGYLSAIGYTVYQAI